MATNWSWKRGERRTLKKVVYAMSEHKLNKVVADHEKRGWSRASENKGYHYGLGCLMEFRRSGT